MSDVFDPNTVLQPITGAPAVNPVQQFMQAPQPVQQYQQPQASMGYQQQAPHQVQQYQQPQASMGYQQQAPQQWAGNQQQGYQQAPPQQYQQGGFYGVNQQEEPPHLFLYAEKTKGGAPMLRGTISEEGKRFLAANLNTALKIKIYYTKQGKASAVAKFYVSTKGERSGYEGFNSNQFTPPNNAPF